MLILRSSELDALSDSTPSGQVVLFEKVASSDWFLSSEWVLPLLEESLPLSFSLWALTSQIVGYHVLSNLQGTPHFYFEQSSLSESQFISW